MFLFEIVIKPCCISEGRKSIRAPALQLWKYLDYNFICLQSIQLSISRVVRSRVACHCLDLLRDAN